MERKNIKLDLEASRKVYFSLGIFIVSALTAMAFTYKAPIHQQEKKIITQEVDIPIMLVEREIEEPIIEPPIPVVTPMSPEPSTPIFSDDLLTNITTTRSTDDDPVTTLTLPTVLDPHLVFNPEPIDEPAPAAPFVEFPDKEAQFVGNWKKFLGSELKYPNISIEFGEEGTVIVRFIVEKDGSVSEVEAINNNVSPDLRKEAIRVVKSSPRWEPGIVKGEYVRSPKLVRINFSLKG